MRPYGVEKGHTNCERCEAIGAETVVANLCNLLAEAARRVNPEAEVLAWPYSAGHVWSADMAQTGFIRRLKPGTAILTEFVKDSVMEKPEGVRKSLWDYSIDLIGPGERAKQQIEACHAAGIPIRVLSMIEETFEASLLPHIPCMDRWADRAEAMTSSGADSVFVFQMGPYDASSAAEINKFLWWDPAPDKRTYCRNSPLALPARPQAHMCGMLGGWFRRPLIFRLRLARIIRGLTISARRIRCAPIRKPRCRPCSTAITCFWRK